MIKKIITAFLLHRNYRKTYNELAKLSARELDDIGIPRSMITRIAMEHARKITL
jgi:uncharacterized protein YjiS (DUF1127 family)